MKLRSAASSIALGACAVLAGASPALAEKPTAASSHVPVSVRPQYVHTAYPGGYPSHSACMNNLVGVNQNGTWTPGIGATWQPRTIGWSSYEEPNEDANCWRLPSGRWTYGAVAYIVNANARDLATFRSQMRTSGYTAYKPVSNARIHRTAHYATQAECERTRTGVIASISRIDGRAIHAGSCVEIVSGGAAAETFSYGQISYQATRAAIGGDYRASNPYFVMKTTWLT